MPLTPRFLAAELALVDAIITEVAGGTAKVTRTAAIVAALRVAVKQGITPASLTPNPLLCKIFQTLAVGSAELSDD